MKRMIVAAVVMLVVSAMAGELLGLFGVENSHLQPALVGLLGATLGGLIARSRFVPAALLVHAAIWLVILYTLHSLANGQSTYLAIASHNASAMALSFPLVGLGAYLGQRLAARRGPSPPVVA